MSKKSTIVKILAFLALFGIVLGIIGTGILFIFGNSQVEVENNPKTISPEELQKMIDSEKIKLDTNEENTK